VSPQTRKFTPTIEPIIVVPGSPPLHDPRWIYEPKFDGFRGVLYVSGRECYIRSKRGDVLSRFADLALRVGAELHARDAILDGEVVALDDEGRMDFRALLAGKGWLHYAAFDLLRLNGKDRSSSESGNWSSLSPPITRRSRGCSPWRSMGVSCSRRPSGWTSRGSWPRERLTRTRRSQSGTR
jgi:hypothetical protein